MSYMPVAGYALQTMTQQGEVASGYYLKFYEANTTTAISMSTDAVGTTLLAKAKLNDNGMPISNPLDNTTVFIPFVNQDYRLVIYTNEADADANNTGAAFVNIPSVPMGSSLDKQENLIINGDFTINQRGVSGTVVLAAGVYGHDRFKAGSSGCTYTFATSAGKTTITISAGSLVQIIEGTNIEDGKTVVLGWGGTAQGQINSGGYGASGVTATTTGGSNITVEFNTGTLELVRLKFGTIDTGYPYRSPADQLAMCKRYFEELCINPSVGGRHGVGYQGSTTTALVNLQCAEKRVVPTVTTPKVSDWSVAAAATNHGLTGLTFTSADRKHINANLTWVTPVGAIGDCVMLRASSVEASIQVDAEL